MVTKKQHQPGPFLPGEACTVLTLRLLRYINATFRILQAQGLCWHCSPVRVRNRKQADSSSGTGSIRAFADSLSEIFQGITGLTGKAGQQRSVLPRDWTLSGWRARSGNC